MKPLLNQNSVYTNSGNRSILKFLDETDHAILDIGCGSGDLGKLIRSAYPTIHVAGITCSGAEYERASQVLDECLHLDIERDPLPQFSHQTFDALIFCHVLEHLVDPVVAIQRLLPYLRPQGKVIIALPNIATWRERWKLALGRFEYTDSGIMDRTHLHFYTFHTASKYLVEAIPQLKLMDQSVTGAVPLAFLRHHLLTPSARNKIDHWGCKLMPNLFGGEILILACTI